MSDVLQLGLAHSRASRPELAVQTSAHPGGNKGVAISVTKVNEKIVQGRNDLRVRAWAGQALKDAGDPSRTPARAQAILDKLRKQTAYVQDPPMTEMIHSAAQTLCLDDKGFCLRAGDCDDMVVAFCSACMSIGIPCKTVIQAFKNEDTFSHILAAVYDEKTKAWLKVDPSTRMPVGQSHFATKEEWFDPLDASPILIEGVGDYIGVGVTPDVTTRALCLGGAVDDTANAVQYQLQNAVDSLRQSVTNLDVALFSLHKIRESLRSGQVYDAELTPPATGINDFPQGGVWTESMDAVANHFMTTAWWLVQWGEEGLRGARTVYVDSTTGVIALEHKVEDAFSLDTVLTTAKDTIIGVYDQAKNLVAGITTQLGAVLTPAQVAAAQQAAGTSVGVQGLGNALVIVVGILGAVVIGVAMYYAFGKLCDMITAFVREATLQEIAKGVNAGKLTPQQAKELLYGVTEARKAEAEADKAKNQPSGIDWASVAKWGAIGAVALAGAYAVGPFLRAWGEEMRAKHVKPRAAT